MKKIIIDDGKGEQEDAYCIQCIQVYNGEVIDDTANT